MKRTDSAACGKSDDRQHGNKEGATLDDPTTARKPQEAASRAAVPPADPRETHLKGPQPAPPADPKEPHLRPEPGPPAGPGEKHLRVSQSVPPTDPKEKHLRMSRAAPPADPGEKHLKAPRRPQRGRGR